jgi:UDP-N-acetylmuramate dehydrogenase
MTSAEERAQKLVRSVEHDLRVQLNVSLRDFTTFGVGGAALALGEPTTEDELQRLIDGAHVASLPVVVIGQGSNLLVADEGVAAMVIVLRGSFTDIRVDEHDPLVLIAGGAAKLPVLARRSAALGLSGLEWAVGVPGSVGGAVRMNAGGHGSDMAANLIAATVFDTTSTQSQRAIANRTLDELQFGYRCSSIQPSDIVLSARFIMTVREVSSAEDQLRDIVRWRREHQPGGANCGSVFTNPPGDSAGRLIDQAGLKGHRIGSAHVSEKHANFIQADPGASQRDISALIVYVQTVVHERFGVELHAEVQTLGITSYQRAS